MAANRPMVRVFTGGVFAENCYVVSCPATRQGILVDPGAAVEEMLAHVKRERIEVKAIVLTHAHIDHVEGVPRAKAETDAPVLLHADDDRLYRQALVQAQWFGVRLDPLPPIDAHLAPGETINFGECALGIRFTPGHAPGHVILVGEEMALVGDCIFAGSIGRTDLPGGDLQTLMSSIRGQILTLPDATVLHTGHGPDTTVGRERASNPFLVPHFGGSNFA
jgi:hydroxyacylglutathione hydrolase